MIPNCFRLLTPTTRWSIEDAAYVTTAPQWPGIVAADGTPLGSFQAWTDAVMDCWGDMSPGERVEWIAMREVTNPGANRPQPPPTKGTAPAAWDYVIGEIEDVLADRGDALGDLERQVVQHVIADAKERDAQGAAKYGVRLTADNGRDHLVDAYQEMLDLLVYWACVLQTTTLADPGASLVHDHFNMMLGMTCSIREMITVRGEPQ